jgi:hypothetical protein
MIVRTPLAMTVLLAVVLISSGGPLRAQSVPPAANVINATCLDPTDDMVLSGAAYSGGFLMCVTTDSNAEGVAVYRESYPGSGAFGLIHGAGGIFRVSDLQAMGVPTADATNLYNSLLSQVH